MPAAILMPHQWDEVKTAYEQGVSYSKLSDSFGISQGAIRKRASVNQWISPARLAQLTHEESLKSKSRCLPSGEMKRLSQDVKGVEVVAENISEIVDKLALRITQTLAKQTNDALDSAPEAFRPTNLKQLGSAVSTIWKVSGRDKPQMSLSVNLWGGNNTQNKGEESECIDLEELEE